MITDKFIHIHVPKTGGQYIRGLINQKKDHWQFISEASHLSLTESKEIFQDLRDGYVDDYGMDFYVSDPPSFTFIRNPWEFYVSRYFFRQKRMVLGHEFLYIPLERTGNNIDGFKAHMHMLNYLITHNERPRLINGDLAPGRTYKYLTISEWHYNLTYPKVDYIGRMENFASDLSKILSTIAPEAFDEKTLKEKASTETANKSEHLACVEYYNDEIKEFVYSWDKKYIEEFNYSFGGR